jgi:hypothetical protein
VIYSWMLMCNMKMVMFKIYLLLLLLNSKLKSNKMLNNKSKTLNNKRELLSLIKNK